MRDLGTPVFGRRSFVRCSRRSPESTRAFVVVFRGEQPVAAGVVHWRGAWMEVPWASALREFNTTCVEHLSLLADASAGDRERLPAFRVRALRRPDEGTFQFKKQWGAEPRRWCGNTGRRAGRCRADLNPQNPSSAGASALWRRLPVPVATALGPSIVRGIPVLTMMHAPGAFDWRVWSTSMPATRCLLPDRRLDARRAADPPRRRSADGQPRHLGLQRSGDDSARSCENSLALDYPAGQTRDRRHLRRVDDGTDAIVTEFAGRGVRLCRQEQRRGKTAG